MKRLYDKDPVIFAVIWIVIYVLLFGNADSLSEQIGHPKLLTVFAGLLLTAVLYAFVHRHALKAHLGLCRAKTSARSMLYYLPLVLASTVNLWQGVQISGSAVTLALGVTSMCFVGILEEIIFRGLLFKGMCTSSVKWAVIVSSLTFGAGHIVNLFFGEPLFDTLLQLFYAAVIGFCYTVLFLKSGTILPCILSHIFINATSLIAPEHSPAAMIAVSGIQSAVCIAYTLWLLRKFKGDDRL